MVTWDEIKISEDFLFFFMLKKVVEQKGGGTLLHSASHFFFERSFYIFKCLLNNVFLPTTYFLFPVLNEGFIINGFMKRIFVNSAHEAVEGARALVFTEVFDTIFVKFAKKRILHSFQ